MGQLVFKRNAKNEMRYGYTPYGTQYTHFVSVLDDSYSLLDKIGRDYSSATYAETLLKDLAALRRQQAWVTGLTFALHLVPFGAAADELGQGNYGEAGISVAADAALFFVPVGKLAKLRPGAIRSLRGAEIGIEAGVGLYRAGQAIDILQREDGTYAEAAGPAGEAMLRLLGISGPVAKELAKLGDYRIEFTPPPSVYAGSGPAGEFQRYFDELKVVRKSKAEVKAEVQLDSLARLTGDVKYKGRNIREYDGRYGPGEEIDWIDDAGRTYDHMGFPDMIPRWELQRANFYKKLHDHLQKVDYTVIDLTQFPISIKQEIATYVLSLPNDQFNKIIPIGF